MSINGARTIDGVYKTSDLYYAAYLKTASVCFLGAERVDNRIVFLFEQNESIRDLKREYFNRTAKLSALSFVDEIRTLKSIIHMNGI